MTRKEITTFLQEHNFRKYADIVSDGNHALFNIFQTTQAYWTGNGYVYLWVEEDKFSVKVVYVGKAGKTMKNRCAQHLNGFRGSSTTGISHSARILGGISAGKQYCVYARKSSSKTIMGKKVSMCSVEEIALIKKLNPEWNSIAS